MPIESIITQPPSNSLRAAYRPIIVRAEAANVVSPKTFGLGVLFGVALIRPLLGVSVSVGDTLTIDGDPSINGDYTIDSVGTVVLSGIQLQVVNTTPDISGVAHPTVNLSVNGVLIVNNDPPPAVYCDVYFDDVFYKSLSKTHPDKINLGSLSGTDTSEYEFDISDAVQEKLKYKVPFNGNGTIVTAPESFKKCYVKLRSSGYDTDGFVSVEGLIPIQGTGSHAPVSGEGEVSNQFYVANSTLQHEDNQDLATHLESFKTGNWQDLAWPLTHRPSVYKTCPGDSDVFPIIYLGDKSPKCIKLFYKLKGTDTFLESQYCSCVPVDFDSGAIPNAIAGVPYAIEITVSGDAPFAIDSSTLPSWMTIDLTGDTLILSGTPDSGDIGADQLIAFQISNSCSDASFSAEIDVAACAIAWIYDAAPPGITLPDGVVGESYFNSLFSIVPYLIVAGSPPFTLSNITKPSWMTITLTNVSGEWRLVFTGTPDVVGTDIEVSFDIINCGGTFSYSDTIDITE